MAVPDHIAHWVMARAPDVEGLLASMFKGTGLLQVGL